MGIITRIIILIACYMLFKEGWQDFKFNSTVSEAKVCTIEELEKIPPGDIPRYIKVKDVKILKGNYVVEVGKKKGDLRAVIYPVFSLKNFLASALRKDSTVKGVTYQLDTTAKIKVKLVVRDNHANKADVESGEYFKKLKSEVEGKYDPDLRISNDTKKLLEDSGFNIDKEAIELSQGGSPWGNIGSISAMIGSSLIGLLMLISFLPTRQPEDKG
ncbi:hypothetical protein [Spirosoma litoris]